MATYNGHNEDSSGNLLLSIGNGMTATVETGTTASQAYTKGAYLFFDNKLCKASQAITSGTTLEIGVNLNQTTLAQELTSHLRATDGTEFYFDVKDSKYGYYPNASKTASEFVPFGGTLSNPTVYVGLSYTATKDCLVIATVETIYTTVNGTTTGNVINSYYARWSNGMHDFVDHNKSLTATVTASGAAVVAVIQLSTGQSISFNGGTCVMEIF